MGYGGAVSRHAGSVVYIWLRLTFLLDIDLANFAGETKIGNATHAHFIDEDVFELDVPMDIACYFVEIADASYDLSEHHPSFI